MQAIIQRLSTEMDIVLFDSPPVLVVADAAILGTIVDGVVLVMDSGRTRTNEARRAADELRRARTKLLGVVLNRLVIGSSGYYYYYYYYHYYYQEDGLKKRPRTRRGIFDRFSPGMRHAQDKPGK
jgi:Mrp family chromosome partitioning ATPase